jgi:hypothetical protein
MDGRLSSGLLRLWLRLQMDTTAGASKSAAINQRGGRVVYSGGGGIAVGIRCLRSLSRLSSWPNAACCSPHHSLQSLTCVNLFCACAWIQITLSGGNFRVPAGTSLVGSIPLHSRLKSRA